jgi:hypothetical protein
LEDPNGAYPLAGLVEDGSGDFFGITQYGGTSGIGTVVEVRAGTGNYHHTGFV